MFSLLLHFFSRHEGKVRLLFTAFSLYYFFVESLHRLSVSGKKCAYQIFAEKSHHPITNILLIVQKPIRNPDTKYLVSLTDERLKWNSHIRNIQITISRNIDLVTRIRKSLKTQPYSACLQLSCTFPPILRNSSSGSYLSLEISTTEDSPTALVRTIVPAHWISRSSSNFKKCCILKINDLDILFQLLALHSSLNNWL